MSATFFQHVEMMTAPCVERCKRDELMEMIFREDASRIRKGQGALAFNVLRKIALNLFRQDTTRAAGVVVRKVVRKKKRVARDDDYRSVLMESAINMRQPCHFTVRRQLQFFTQCG